METYYKDVSPTYVPPKSYVRYRRPTQEELYSNLEYVVDAEDEVWLHNNAKFGGASVKVDAKKRTRNEVEDDKGVFQLPLGMLKTMLDVMEKATAFDAIITMD